MRYINRLFTYLLIYLLTYLLTYQSCQHVILKTNELISMQIGTSSPTARAKTVNFEGQDAKGQGHRRP